MPGLVLCGVLGALCVGLMAVQTPAQITGSDLTTSAVNHVTELKVKGDGDPIGTIKAWPSSQTPNTEEWLECDGSTFDTTKYPELYAALGSGRLPDYKGQFLRGGSAADAGKKFEDTIKTHEVIVPSHSHEFTLDISGTVQTASIQKNVKVLSTSSSVSSSSDTGDTKGAFFYYKQTGGTCVGMTDIQVAKYATSGNIIPKRQQVVSGGSANTSCWPGTLYNKIPVLQESNYYNLYNDSTCSNIIAHDYEEKYAFYVPQSGFVGVGNYRSLNNTCGPFYATTNVGSLNIVDEYDKMFYYKESGGLCVGMSVEDTVKYALSSNANIGYQYSGANTSITYLCWNEARYNKIPVLKESNTPYDYYSLYSDSTCSNIIAHDYEEKYAFYVPQSGFVGVGNYRSLNNTCGPFYATGTYKTVDGANEISIPVVKADTSSLDNGKVTGTIGESGQLIGTYNGASETAPKHTIVRYFIKAL